MADIARLSEVIGQQTAHWCLRGLLRRDRPHHALLFHGPNGCGKRAAAMAWAAALNCERRSGDDACGECGSCRRVARDVDVDVRFFQPIKGEYTVAQIKEIRDEAFLTPNTGPWKILVLDDADRLSRESGNRLLKVLEEPPQTTVFVLLTAAVDRVLSTIRSRTLPVPFRPLDVDEALRVAGDGADPDTIRFLYETARGDMSVIMSLAGDKELRGLFDDIRRLTADHILRRSTCSPTWLGDRIMALGEKFPVAEMPEDVKESESARTRRGVLAILDVILSEMRLGYLESAAADRREDMMRMRDRVECALAAGRAVAGMGGSSLVLEGFALGLADINGSVVPEPNNA